MSRQLKARHHHGTLIRRTTQGIAATAIALGASLGAVNPASAAQVDEFTCKYQVNNYNICFEISTYGLNAYKIHVGIDVYMSQQDAQNLLDGPGQEFNGYLVADDEWFDNTLRAIPLTWAAAGETGVGAEFDSVVFASDLDEDPGGDEIYARIKLHDSRSDTTREFTTNVVYGQF